MVEISNMKYQNRLSMFISGSFCEHSPTSPGLQSPFADMEIFSQSTQAMQMRSSVGSPVRSSTGQSDSNFTSAQGVEVLAASIEAQRTAIASLRRGWLEPMKAVMDATGRLSDVTRCYRLSRVIDVNAETIGVEEELRRQLASAGNQKLPVSIKNSIDAIHKDSMTLQADSDGQLDAQVDRKTVEIKIYYCHESVERILRSLLSVVSTLTGPLSPVSADGSPIFEFDRFRPTLMSTSSVETLFMALPQKYSLEIISGQ